MIKRKMAITFVAFLTLSVGAYAQEDGGRYPLRGDIETLDGIIDAYYEIVSGPAGQAADRARDESIHYPGARVGISGVDREGNAFLRSMIIGEYHDQFGGPRQQPFFEWEINRITQRFGNVAHVWSTYVTSDAPNGEARSRGINSIQLYFDGDRWWVTGWIFDSERAGNPIPPGFLPSDP